jgi:hypothetical protein
MNWGAFVEIVFILLVCPAAVIGYRDVYQPRHQARLLQQLLEEQENDRFWKELRKEKGRIHGN